MNTKHLTKGIVVYIVCYSLRHSIYADLQGEIKRVVKERSVRRLKHS